jgi:translation initiation factor 4E
LLNSNWNFWYISRKEKIHNVPYEERLKNIATFSTLEEFFRYYAYLKSASDIERNSDLSIFKSGYKPLWESCPDGGCWFIRFKKNEDAHEMDLKWEKLLFALIGKSFFLI